MEEQQQTRQQPGPLSPGASWSRLEIWAYSAGLGAVAGSGVAVWAVAKDVRAVRAAGSAAVSTTLVAGGMLTLADVLAEQRGVSDVWNPLLGGALTGYVLGGFHGGPRRALSSSLSLAACSAAGYLGLRWVRHSATYGAGQSTSAALADGKDRDPGQGRSTDAAWPQWLPIQSTDDEQLRQRIQDNLDSIDDQLCDAAEQQHKQREQQS